MPQDALGHRAAPVLQSVPSPELHSATAAALDNGAEQRTPSTLADMLSQHLHTVFCQATSPSAGYSVVHGTAITQAAHLLVAYAGSFAAEALPAVMRRELERQLFSESWTRLQHTESALAPGLSEPATAPGMSAERSGSLRTPRSQSNRLSQELQASPGRAASAALGWQMEAPAEAHGSPGFVGVMLRRELQEASRKLVSPSKSAPMPTVAQGSPRRPAPGAPAPSPGTGSTQAASDVAPGMSPVTPPVQPPRPPQCNGRNGVRRGQSAATAAAVHHSAPAPPGERQSSVTWMKLPSEIEGEEPRPVRRRMPLAPVVSVGDSAPTRRPPAAAAGKESHTVVYDTAAWVSQHGGPPQVDARAIEVWGSEAEAIAAAELVVQRKARQLMPPLQAWIAQATSQLAALEENETLRAIERRKAERDLRKLQSGSAPKPGRGRGHGRGRGYGWWHPEQDPGAKAAVADEQRRLSQLTSEAKRHGGILAEHRALLAAAEHTLARLHEVSGRQ